MTILIHEIPDDAAWHKLRRAHVGASESPVLLGLSKWKTKWRLWHEKKGTLEHENLDDNKAVETGRHMEPALAAWAAEKFDWSLRKVHRYLSDPDTKAGASLDFETTQGLEPVEVKFSMGFTAADPDEDWDWEGDIITRAPAKYVVQVQHQLMLRPGKDRGWLLDYVGNAPRRMEVPRSEPIIERVRAEVRQFWASIAAEQEPAVDWFADAEGVAKLLQHTDGTTVTLTDSEAEKWAAQLQRASALEKEADKLKAEAKGQLWTLAGPAATAMVGTLKVDMGYTGPTTGKLVTPDMVGTYIGGRQGFRRCQIRLKAQQKKGDK